MGMCTEIFLTVVLKKDMPPETMCYIEAGIVNDKKLVDDCPEGHKEALFEYPLLWDCHSFAGRPFGILEYNCVSEVYYFTLLTSLNNDEIKKLIEMLRPYLCMESGEMMGYTRCEEDKEPTILYV